MRFSQATNYALHAMLHLTALEDREPTGVQVLAERLNVSPTYLSKMMTKLVKAGLVQSISGAKGGYRLSRSGGEASFLDVIHAIEGTASIFECSTHHGSKCLIEQVMLNAERQMDSYLREAKIADLRDKM